jgi:surface polysaccharide O-acyltransferase-like enzyme
LKTYNNLEHPNKNIYWLDYLRVLATFAVILWHVSGINVTNEIILGQYAWQVGLVFNSSMRWAVMIFVMISGVLLLGKEIDLIPFLKKRLSRIILPFLFWSVIYSVHLYCNDGLYNNLNIISTVASYYKVICSNAAFHLWYVYFFIGLTLFTPIINRWIMHAPTREIKYFLIIWFTSLLFLQPYIKAWVPLIDLSFFSSYLGFYVLGYYLNRLTININTKQKMGLAICLVILLVLSFILTQHLSIQAGKYIETFNHWTSWNIILIAVSIFLLCMHTTPRLNLLNKSMRLLSKYSYGIYLSHIFVLTYINYWLTPFYASRPVSSILFGSMACFVLSFLLVYLLSKIPFLKKMVG